MTSKCLWPHDVQTRMMAAELKWLRTVKVRSVPLGLVGEKSCHLMILLECKSRNLEWSWSHHNAEFRFMLSSCTFPSGHDSYVPLPCNPGKSEGKFEVSSSHTHTSETTFLPATVTNDDHTESTVTMFIVIAVVSSVILLFSVISVLAMCASCRRRRKKNYRKTQKAKEGPIRTISQNFSRYATRGPKDGQWRQDLMATYRWTVEVKSTWVTRNRQ